MIHLDTTSPTTISQKKWTTNRSLKFLTGRPSRLRSEDWRIVWNWWQAVWFFLIHLKQCAAKIIYHETHQNSQHFKTFHETHSAFSSNKEGLGTRLWRSGAWALKLDLSFFWKVACSHFAWWQCPILTYVDICYRILTMSLNCLARNSAAWTEKISKYYWVPFEAWPPYHEQSTMRLHMDAVILAKFINGMNFRKSVRPGAAVNMPLTYNYLQYKTMEALCFHTNFRNGISEKQLGTVHANKITALWIQQWSKWLRLPGHSFIAYRESCASLIRLCTDSPHLLGHRPGPWNWSRPVAGWEKKLPATTWEQSCKSQNWIVC